MLLHGTGQQHPEPLHRWLPITVALLAAMAFAWTLGAHSVQPGDLPESVGAADTRAQVSDLSNEEQAPECIQLWQLSAPVQLLSSGCRIVPPLYHSAAVGDVPLGAILSLTCALGVYTSGMAAVPRTSEH